jgi:acyl-CoA synthetase (NDP forming)
MGNRLAKDIVEASRTTDKPVLVIWGSPVGNEDTYVDILLPGQVPVFRTFGNAVQAATAYFDYHEFRSRFRSPFAKPVLRPSPAAASARAAGIAPDEFSSMRVLAEYGIAVPRHELVTTRAAATRASDSIGFPVVLKACGADILHKSDLGLVLVGLTSATQVRAGFDELMAKAPGADGVIVSEMIGGDGVECVVGMTHDELFGPVVMVGLGGVFVEVLKDVAFRVPPFDKAEARRMVEELQGLPLLQGARGRAKADIGALVDVIMKVQRLALDLADDVAELDINPLVVQPKGAVALDALIVPKE